MDLRSAAPAGLFPPRLTAGLQTLTLCIVVRIHGRERTPLQMEEELFQAVHGLEWIWKHVLLTNVCSRSGRVWAATADAGSIPRR